MHSNRNATLPQLVFLGVKATWTHGLLVFILAWLVFASVLPRGSQGGNQFN